MYTTDVLKKRMTDGAYDAELSKLYPSGTVDAQKSAIAALSESSRSFTVRAARRVSSAHPAEPKSAATTLTITTDACSLRASILTL